MFRARLRPVSAPGLLLPLVFAVTLVAACEALAQGAPEAAAAGQTAPAPVAPVEEQANPAAPRPTPRPMTLPTAPHSDIHNDLRIPDLRQVSFAFAGLRLSGLDILHGGLIVCLLGLLFGLWQYIGIRRLPVHSAMAEVSVVIWETCKTYLLPAGAIPDRPSWGAHRCLHRLLLRRPARPVLRPTSSSSSPRPSSASSAPTSSPGSASASTPWPTPAPPSLALRGQPRWHPWGFPCAPA